MAVGGEHPRPRRAGLGSRAFAGGGELGSGGGTSQAAATTSVAGPAIEQLARATAIGDLHMLDLANHEVGSLRRRQQLVEQFSRLAHREKFAAAVALRFTANAGAGRPEATLWWRDGDGTGETPLSPRQSQDLMAAIRLAGLGVIVMARDLASATLAADLDFDTWKIASDDMGDADLVAAMAGTGRPIMAAADRAPLEQVEALVASLVQHGYAYAFKHAVYLHAEGAGTDLVPQRKARLVMVFNVPEKSEFDEPSV